MDSTYTGILREAESISQSIRAIAIPDSMAYILLRTPEDVMDNKYIEFRDGGYWMSGSRVSLDSLVYAFLDGLSPETIAYECYLDLTLEQVYGGITYYLAHRATIDAYLKEGEKKFDELRQQAIAKSPELYRRLAAQRSDSLVNEA
jgi:uncharacterized protein (DUF433 family)